MKVKQLLVLLAAPAVVSINAFDDDLAWQYDDDYGYDDDDDYDDRNEGFISSGPSSGFVAESLMQDRSEGYVSTSFNGTTTVLESYGEHGRELIPGFTFGICIGIIAIVGLVSAEFAGGFCAHQIPVHSDIKMSKVSALKVFNDDNEQQFLFKLEDDNGNQLDPKKYLDVKVLDGAVCRQDMPHDEEEKAWVKVLCAPPNGGNLKFNVVAAKKIKRTWKLEIFPMHGRYRVLGQSSTAGANEKGKIIFAPEEYGHYWMKRNGTRSEGGKVIREKQIACTLIASKLPELKNSDEEDRSAVIMKWIFEKYPSSTGDQIIQAINLALWAAIIHGFVHGQRTLQSTEEDEYGFGITSTHTGRGDALRVRIYSDSATINLAHTMHGGDGSWHHINNRYIMKSIPQGSTSAPMQTAIVSVSDPGEFRVVLDHDGDGQGLAGIVGITPYNGGNIDCTTPEFIDEEGVQCAWTVLDNGTVEAYFRVY